MNSTDAFGDLIDDAHEKTKWNRQTAMDLLEKANEIERQAAETADKLRNLAGLLVLEAQAFAEDTANYLMAEFPMEEGVNGQED